MKRQKNTEKKENKLYLFYQNNQKIIIAAIIGFIIGFTCMQFFIPERISKLENGEEPVVTLVGKTISADEYYENLKSKLHFELLIEDVDKYILDTVYETDKEMEKEVTKKMNDTIKEYTDYYGYTVDDFIKNNQLGSKEEFYNMLLTDYKRNRYFQDYIRIQITDDDVSNYYKNMMKEAEIKYIATADEDDCHTILNDAKKGLSYEQLVNVYRSTITHKKLGYIAFDNQEVDKVLLNAASKIKANSYYSSCVVFNNSYAVVFKGSEKEKDSLENLKPRIIDQIIIEKMAEDANNDSKLYNKALIELRDKYQIKFNDTRIAKEYKEFINQYK